MKKIAMCIVAILCSLFAFAQEKNDGLFIGHMMNTDAVDLKCETYPDEVKAADVQRLFDSNRYVISIIHTKNGTLVLHKENTAGAKQIFEFVKVWDVKKTCKKYLKKGYVLDFFNNEKDYAIFRNEPKATKVKFIKFPDQKKITKANKSGFYVTVCPISYMFVAYNAATDIVEQKYCFYTSNQNFLNGFSEEAGNSWILKNVIKSYSNSGNKNYFYAVFNKYKEKYDGHQHVFITESIKRFAELVGEEAKPGYNLTEMSGGWDNEESKVLARALENESSENIFDILSGLTNSISALTGKGGNTTNQTTSNQTVNTVNNGSGSSKKPAVSVKNKCKHCAGNGNCTPASAGARKNACYGSGKCGYCSGTGWNTAGGSKYVCTACKGNGKCKTCKGTGKCTFCKGTGKGQ